MIIPHGSGSLPAPHPKSITEWFTVGRKLKGNYVENRLQMLIICKLVSCVIGKDCTIQHNRRDEFFYTLASLSHSIGLMPSSGFPSSQTLHGQPALEKLPAKWNRLLGRNWQGRPQRQGEKAPRTLELRRCRGQETWNQGPLRKVPAILLPLSC